MASVVCFLDNWMNRRRIVEGSGFVIGKMGCKVEIHKDGDEVFLQMFCITSGIEVVIIAELQKIARRKKECKLMIIFTILISSLFSSFLHCPTRWL